MTIGKTGFIPIFFIILILISACATDKDVISYKNTNLPIETDTRSIENDKKPELSTDEILDLRIESIINDMSLDEKIGQLFIISVRNSYNGSRMLHADNYMKEIIEKYKPGGLILFSVNFSDPIQTRDLIRDTQALSRIPMFMAVDEEGGIVARLGNSERMSVTKLPPAAVIGRTGNTEYARIAARVISEELKAFGFNMNMAPVADVNTNSKNPIIGNRTYSSTPYEAGVMVAAVTETMAEENMISVLKHFPGHGDSSTDTHKGDVILNHNIERLEKIEFIPFRMGIEAGADVVMTAHIKVPAVTGSDMPATMSPVLLQDILRKNLGFEGIIITDAMDMGAIKQYWSADEAAVNALKAGIDIILIPASIYDAVRGIKSALNSGELSMERIDQSLRRILKVKLKHGLFLEGISGAENILSKIGSKEHRDLIDQIPR